MKLKLAGVICLGLLLSGCAAQSGPKQRYFWPIGGAEPKIEYVGFYQTDQNIRHQESPLLRAVLGVEQGKLLFGSPHGIGSRESGAFAVTDPGQGAVLVCDLVAGEVRWLQDPEGGNYQFKFPVAVVYRPDGGGYVADTFTNLIYEFNASEVVVRELGADAQLKRPNGLAYDPSTGFLYVVDSLNHRIVVFDSAGRQVRAFGKRGTSAGEFNFPLDADLAPGGQLVVLDSLNARVQIFDREGRFVRAFGERGTASGSFQIPKSLAVDGFGHIYVTDARAHKVVVFDLAGNFLLSIGGRAVMKQGRLAPGGFNLPKGISADSAGQILIVDSLNRLIHRYQFLSENYLSNHPL